MRLFKSHYIIRHINDTLVDYKSPTNLNYFWNYGVIAGICLIIQICSGLVLAMHYTANSESSFECLDHIMRDVNNGYLIRYFHSNGASMFFVVIYIHIFRGMYYVSYGYPRHMVWWIGVIILLLMIITAFMGYILPWGQMSFWGATVITNLCSAIPKAGLNIVLWLWGGFSVDNPTLNRFYSLHYLLPFLIVGGAVFHLLVLHEEGSNNPLGLYNQDLHKIVFHRYFSIKDYLGILLFFVIFFYFVFFNPNILGHPDNYIPANSLKTPAHIVPEWYFLPFYAILRCITNKLAGVTYMLLSIVVLFTLPLYEWFKVKSSTVRPLFRFFLWIWIFNSLILGILGGMPITYPYFFWSKICSFIYFIYFLLVLPVVNIIECLIYGADKKKRK